MTQDFCLVLCLPLPHFLPSNLSECRDVHSPTSSPVADPLLCNDTAIAPLLSWVSLSWPCFAQ